MFQKADIWFVVNFTQLCIIQMCNGSSYDQTLRASRAFMEKNPTLEFGIVN